MTPACIELAVLSLTVGSALPADEAIQIAHQELTEMNRLEQEAFVDGDCDALVAMLDDDITFYANGRLLSRQQVGEFCQRIPRPFPRSGEVDTRIEALSANAGYVLRFISFPESNRVEVVTKIWSKGSDGWKMEHFQSTVTDPEPRPEPD